MHFLKRAITDILLSRIDKDRLFVITGARQTGKTTLCENILPEMFGMPAEYITFDDPDERFRFQRSAISILESMEKPVIVLDEVQKAPFLFDPLKYVVDRQKKSEVKKTFIITGSSQLLLMKNVKETLSGRAVLFHLYPFSLAEIVATGSPSLLTQIWQERVVTKNQLKQFDAIPPDTVRRVMNVRNEHQTWGGYPPVWERKTREDKINWLKDYRKTYLDRDIFDVGQVSDIDTFAVTQRMLCSRTGQILKISEIARDISLSVNTIKRYVHLLSMSFHCYTLQPYYENIGKRFIKSPKIFFPDVGLNRVILGDAAISAGASYETWVFFELIKWKQLQPVEPDMFFYRTAGGLEIDFLLCGEGIILPVEVKFSEKADYADARHLEVFMKEHTEVAPLGIVVYRGRECKEIRPNIWAIPDWYLFGGM